MAEAAARGRTRAPDALAVSARAARPMTRSTSCARCSSGPSSASCRIFRETSTIPPRRRARSAACCPTRSRLRSRRRAAQAGAGADRRGSDHVPGAAGSAPSRRRALPHHRSGHPQGHRAHAGRHGGVAQSHRRAQLLVAGAPVALDRVPHGQAVRGDRPAQHAAISGRAGASHSRRNRPAAAAPLADPRASQDAGSGVGDAHGDS